MPTPRAYHSVSLECDAIKAMAFKLLMSDEIQSIDGPFAAQLFDLVADRTDKQADEEIAAFKATT